MIFWILVAAVLIFCIVGAILNEDWSYIYVGVPVLGLIVGFAFMVLVALVSLSTFNEVDPRPAEKVEYSHSQSQYLVETENEFFVVQYSDTTQLDSYVVTVTGDVNSWILAPFEIESIKGNDVKLYLNLDEEVSQKG